MCTHVQLLQLLRDRTPLPLPYRYSKYGQSIQAAPIGLVPVLPDSRYSPLDLLVPGIRNIKIHFQLVNVEVRNRPEILKFITKYRLHVSMHMRLSFKRLRNAQIKSSFYHTRTCLPLPCFFQGSVVYAAIYSVYTSPQVFSTKFRAIPGTEYPI